MTRGPTLEQAKLAAELAALRERVGLSLSGLAQRTTASRSSWQRYLNGSKLPPRELVRELCELAQVPPGRLLALWQLADAARRDPAASRGTASEPQARAAASPVPEGAPEPP
ncbi:helix-turn-helix domain-containing protein, partial [Streptomyces sparsus]